MTPHIEAKKEDIAKIVIAAGDPLRAKKVADEYLTDIKLVNSVRNMLMFTGKYQGKLVTVIGHGMGISSVAIYAHELFAFYDVKRIIRVGSAGSLNKDINIMDIIVGETAEIDTNFMEEYGIDEKVISANSSLVELAKKNPISKELKFGKLLSSQWFYHPKNPNGWKEHAKKGSLAVEMEAAALYAIAKHFNREALTMVTVSDSLVTGESLSPEKRQNTFNKMLKFALDTYVE